MKRFAQASLLVALAAYALGFWNAWLLPPVGTDSLIYHLTIPAYWLQRGFLAPVELPFHDSAAEHSPLLAETINYVLMAISGDDSLVWAVQPAFLLATFWLYYLSARLLGAGRPAALLLTALLAQFEPFLSSARMSNNELVMTCGVAWMLYGVLLTRVRPRHALVHWACGLGLAAATKYVGLIYAVVGVVVFVPLFWLRLRRRKHAATRWRGYRRTAVVVLALFVGGSFYLRNWTTLGNPVYPARVQVAGVTLFQGLYDPSRLVAHGWQPAVFAKLLVHSPEDFAIRMPTSLLLWAGFGASIVPALWRRRRRQAWLPLTAVAVYPSAVLLVYFWKVPFWNEHRLLFPVYYTLWLSVGSAFGQLRRSGTLRSKGAWVLLGLFVVQFGWGVNERLEAFFSAVALPHWSRGEIREQRYQAEYPTAAQTWNWIHALKADRTAVIGYAGTATIFPLFGPRQMNEVVYVPVSPDDRPQPIETSAGESLYKGLAEARRRNPDRAFWLQGLVKRRVQYLYLVDNPALGGVRQELGMIEQVAERFELVLQERGVYLYRVRTAP